MMKGQLHYSMSCEQACSNIGCPSLCLHVQPARLCLDHEIRKHNHFSEEALLTVPFMWTEVGSKKADGRFSRCAFCTKKQRAAKTGQRPTSSNKLLIGTPLL